jgi:hypothetical protein
VIVEAHLHLNHLPALGWTLEAAERVRRLRGGTAQALFGF